MQLTIRLHYVVVLLVDHMSHPFLASNRYPKTLVDLLQLRAEEQPDKRAFLYLINGEEEGEALTFAELDYRARQIAVELQRHVSPGDRAILLYPPGLDYIAAFFGCLYAGVVAVPAYPPRKNRSLARIEGIVTDADVSVALTTPALHDVVTRRFADEPMLTKLHWLTTGTTSTADADAWEAPAISGDTLAFLQYTSGSTGQPKGVMVSHANLLANEQVIHSTMGTRADDVIVGWLPLYHDMGLIGIVLQPVYLGSSCVLMAPYDFLRKPLVWLQAISKYKGTVSGGPNFAYDLCRRKISTEQRATLDLSGWRIAFNGAEPVRAETLERFADTFKPQGFQRKAMLPCYGLAESTLLVTGKPGAEAPQFLTVAAEALEGQTIEVAAPSEEGAWKLVSSGEVGAGFEVCIVNPSNGQRCAEHQVGEIWVQGDSIARGYWNRENASSDTFGATLDGYDGTFLRTGDLGFVNGKQVYVTGRLKDLIIVRGRNHYPQDLEKTAESAHPALRPNSGAAVSVTIENEERVILVHEVTRPSLRDLNAEEIAAAVREAIAARHELQVYSVGLLKTGSIPKTSSGKIQRRACRKGYLDGTLNIVGEHTLSHLSLMPTGGDGALDPDVLTSMAAEERAPHLAAHLHEMVARILSTTTTQISKHHSLAQLGLDSLGAVELRNEVEGNLGIVLSADEDLSGLSVSQLAEQLASQLAPANAADAPPLAKISEATPTDLFAKCEGEGGYFGYYRKRGDRYFTQPVLEGNPGPEMRFQGRDVVVWSINNYLGLCGNPHVHTAAKSTVDKLGTWTPMGSRMLTGNSDKHIALEARLAAHLQKEASIVFNFGYMGVLGTMASLIEKQDVVIIDSLSHACIVDGAVLASAGRAFRVFNHNDMDSLEAQLKAANRNRRGGVLVVTEGVFGMTGDLAPLPEIVALKDQYGARLFVDDAHGYGIMGSTGAGTGEHQGCQDGVDLYFGTFAKSFSAIGGVTAGPKSVIEYIRYNARTNIFAKSLPMVYVDAVDAAMDVIEAEPERRTRAFQIAHMLQDGLRDMGFNLGKTASVITPVYVPAGDESQARDMMKMMRTDFGIFLSAVTYPVVPQGVVLFRMTPTAAHTEAHVERTLDAFRQLRERMGLDAQPSVTLS